MRGPSSPSILHRLPFVPAPHPPLTSNMSANGDSVEAKLADLDVKDSAVAEDREKDVSTSSQSAGEQKVIAKFLMSNPAAGSIIGKGGANISELQSQSGARLQLSRANEFFPGTQDRVMLASGSVNQVLTALHLIWTKIQGEQVGLPKVCQLETCAISSRNIVKQYHNSDTALQLLAVPRQGGLAFTSV